VIILCWFSNPWKFVNEVLEILRFGCFIMEGVLHLLCDYIVANADVWETGLKSWMVL